MGEPRADEDGCCTRCGLEFEDPQVLTHECPPGFVSDAAVEAAGGRASAPDALRAEGGGAAAPQAAGTAADGPPPRLSDLLRWLGEEWEEATCLECREPFHRRRGSAHEWCPGCEQREHQLLRAAAQAKWVLEHAEHWLPTWCKAAGMSPREFSASLDSLTPEVRRLFRAPSPGMLVRSMVEGRLPEHGFGLSGGAGTGKTFALAAVVKRLALERLKIEAPLLGKRAMRQWLLWVRWPEEVANARASASGDAFHVVERRTLDMIECEALVLDDLGAERMKADYSEDWVTSMLDRVIDQRFNNLRPTWWTTNLSREEFAHRYGARMFSRLHGDSPMAVLDSSAPDQRMVRK